MAKKSPSKSGLYTYRNGKKVYLKKEPDQFVVRARPEDLAKKGIVENETVENVEKVSANSSRVTVSNKKRDTMMKELREDTVTHHAYTQQENNAEFLITDRIFVTFKQPASNELVSKFMAKYALVLRSQYSEREYLFQLTDQTGMNPVKLVVVINEKEKQLVESCEHDLNKRMTISDVNLPSDAKYTQQWHLHTRLVHSAIDPRSSSKCEGAWTLLNHFGSNDVVIAVSDDGCKLDHTDFDSPNKFAHWGYMEGNSLINRDSVSANPTKMYQSGADHGTCCCGVVAAEIDGALTVGAAPGCRLLPIKWESSGPSLLISDSKMLTVLNFISDKADVLSNSWGSSPEFLFATNVISKITQLAQTGGRRGKGIVFLWAAGNENCPIQHSGTLNIPYDNGYNEFGSWQGVSTSKIFEHNLVGIPGVMHVAALASNAQRSHYSNYGVGISICAPSSNSHEYWRMAVTGLGILTTSGRSPFFDSEFGGTSSATPLAAGIAGLVISANPNLTAPQVVSILQRTAAKDLNMTAYQRTPPAPYDTNTSWDISPIAPHNAGTFNNVGHADGTWSGWFGFGKVDATAAVAEALRVAGGLPGSGNTIVQSSTPAKPIPDNNATGITDSIVVNGSGTIASVKVDLRIVHTYIGDLVASIVSPSGSTVVLHNRNGGNTDNLNKVFDLQNTPSLSILNGEPVNGTWTLFVADKAPADTGILSKWTLHIGTSQTQAIALEEAPGVMIPDNNSAGIERSLNVSENATIKEIEVGIDVTHSYISDLIVNLVSPLGSVTTLHSRTGGTADNIIKTYNFTNSLNLRTLMGQAAKGVWKLRISDVVGQDVGKLNKWSLRIIKQ
jgi:subtilisin-like proprotein convertase family protein